MKIAKISLMVLGAAGVSVPVCQDGEPALASGAQEQQSVQESSDADKLYDLVKQARADLQQMRVAAGLGTYAAGPQAGRPESHERGAGAGEHGGQGGRGEGAERGGGHGRGGEGGGEEGAYVPKMTKQNELFANGARLVLAFDPATQVFARLGNEHNRPDPPAGEGRGPSGQRHGARSDEADQCRSRPDGAGGAGRLRE